jgi:hypothetical protein
VSKATQHRKAFRDIVRGFSTSELGGDLIYIKHLTPHDQVELEDITELYHNRAKDRGLPTEEETLRTLKSEGDWTQKDEDEIEKRQNFIDVMEQAKPRLVLKSALDRQNKIIEKESSLLQKKVSQRSELLGHTCEKYAEGRAHDFYILASFFKDKSCVKPLYSQPEYDELSRNEVAGLVATYNHVFESYSENSVQDLVLEDFYQPYLNFADDSMQFYGKPFCVLTYNQVRMIVYTRIFKNIFESNQNIPEQIRKNPRALLDYGSVSSEEKEKMEERLGESAGATLVGATEEDYEYLGITKPDSGISLHAEAKKKGGSLTMEDMMKLSGVS